jgi:hypothetical protein
VARLAGFIAVMVSVAGGYLGYFLTYSRAGHYLGAGVPFYLSFFLFIAGLYAMITGKWE